MLYACKAYTSVYSNITGGGTDSLSQLKDRYGTINSVPFQNSRHFPRSIACLYVTVHFPALYNQLECAHNVNIIATFEKRNFRLAQ